MQLQIVIVNFQIILRILQWFKTINFVKYELKIKIVSSFGDGYILKKIKCMFLTFLVIVNFQIILRSFNYFKKILNMNYKLNCIQV